MNLLSTPSDITRSQEVTRQNLVGGNRRLGDSGNKAQPIAWRLSSHRASAATLPVERQKDRSLCAGFALTLIGTDFLRFLLCGRLQAKALTIPLPGIAVMLKGLNR